MTNTLPSLTIVMPCLDEEENVASSIRRTLAALAGHGIDGEIVVVNDGSTDGTRDIVLQFVRDNQNIRMIEHPRPMGIGASFWDGIGHARKDFVTMLPSDDEGDTDDALLCYYLSRDVDIIVPFIHNACVRSLGRRLI